MLKVETILLGFIVWEKNAVTAMVSMTVQEDIIEFEGPERAYNGVDAPVVVTGITAMLQKIRTEIEVEGITGCLHRLLWSILHLLLQSPSPGQLPVYWHLPRILSRPCLSLRRLSLGDVFVGCWW